MAAQRGAALLALLLTTRTAAADPAEIAKAADESARSHYDLREYEAAIADYRRAFAALPDPLFLFDIAQSYRLLHDCENARAFYRNYLRERPDADNRAKVEQLATECVPAPTPTPTPRPPPPRTQSSLRLGGIVTGFAGLAITGAGILFSSHAADDARQLERACTPSCAAADVIAIDNAGHTANRDAIAAYIVGGAALAAGVALILWSTLHDEPIAIAPAPGGAVVSASVRF